MAFCKVKIVRFVLSLCWRMKIICTRGKTWKQTFCLACLCYLLVLYNVKEIVMDRIPVVTKNLLAINVVMFLALIVAEKNGIDLNNILALHFYMSEEFHPYQLFTYMFMHGGFSHLFFNMFALFMFGRTLEYVWGPKRFLIFYVLAGVGAALVFSYIASLLTKPKMKKN